MKNIIRNYIENITTENVINFGIDNNITVDNFEATVILYHLKNNWEELLYGDPLPIIRKLEDEIGKTKCDKIKELLYFYKDKYKNYL